MYHGEIIVLKAKEMRQKQNGALSLSCDHSLLSLSLRFWYRRFTCCVVVSWSLRRVNTHAMFFNMVVRAKNILVVVNSS